MEIIRKMMVDWCLVIPMEMCGHNVKKIGGRIVVNNFSGIIVLEIGNSVINNFDKGGHCSFQNYIGGLCNCYKP